MPVPSLLLSVALVAATLGGCPSGRLARGPAPEVRTGAPESPAPTRGDTLVVLERTECYGKCPAYTVVISGGGAVLYSGTAHVTRTGEVRDTLGPGAVRRLVAAFDAAGHSAFPDSLSWGSSACETISTDNPTTTTTLTIGTRTKRVVHYYGCRGFTGEAALTALETEIDRVAGTDRWAGRAR